MLPSPDAALRFVCHCFDIGEKELAIMLQSVRQHTGEPDLHFPKTMSRTLIARAEHPDGPWHDALGLLRRETL